MGKKDIPKKKLLISFINSHLALIVLGFILIILMLLVIISLEFRSDIVKRIQATQLPPSLVDFKPGKYPMIQTYYDPYVSAESAVVMDRDSKRLLFEKRPHLRFSMASTTKLMTALVALEYFEYNDILQVKKSFTEGSVIGFRVGDEFYFEDLLYGLLLQSGNDVAHIIADNYPGGYDGFVKRMNEKTKEIGLKHTHFADPAGLNDDQNYTTAHDLAMFSSFALQNPTIARVVNTKQKLFSNVSGSTTYSVYNLNELLGTNGVTGIKTGTTRGAGEVLTTAVEKNGRDYIIVVMRSEDRFSDTLNLIYLIDNNVTLQSEQDLVAK